MTDNMVLVLSNVEDDFHVAPRPGCGETGGAKVIEKPNGLEALEQRRASVGHRMPKDSDFKRLGVLFKKAIDTTGIVWHKRIVGLAVDRVMYAKADDPNRTVLDYIKYEDMVECEQKRDEDDPTLTEIIFRTEDTSRNGGRSYIFRCSTKEAADWEKDVDEVVEVAQEAQHDAMMQEKFGHSTFAMQRAKCKIMFESIAWQYMVAAAILTAFLVDVLEVQVLPVAGTLAWNIFFWLDVIITGLFTLDLCVNIFANSSNCCREFYRQGMNWFDAIIVVVSIFGVWSQAQGHEPVPLKV
jgi:hypothetical protein